jgi:phosphoserine phosphatase RsbU/P
MHKWIALLLLCASSLCFSQAPATVNPQQCVWRAGDDPAWAAPSLDESAWRPLTGWTMDLHQPRIWIRCHVDLASLRQVADPGIQVNLSSAYELFVNGRRIAVSGNLRSGTGRNDAIRSWPVPRELTSGTAVIALRVAIGFGLGDDSSVTLRIGSLAALKARRDSVILASVTTAFSMAVCYIVIGAIGFALLGFYFSDRARAELLWLGICCVAIALLRLCIFTGIAQAPMSAFWPDFAFDVGNVILPVAETLFFFRVAGRPMPTIARWLLCAELAWTLTDLFVESAGALSFGAVLANPWMNVLMLMTSLAEVAAAAWFAFMPLRSLPRRTRLLAILCCIWAAADCVWFALETTTNLPGVPNLFDRWYLILAASRGYALLAIVITLMALLLREQRQIAEDRALLAAEMQAAREIQRMLAPSALCATSGFEIEVAYRPVRDVGGDFYLCKPLADGRQRLVVGDVSGKGTAAAMTAALLIGGAEDHNDYAPGQLLAHLDRVLRESQVGGLATCLCADFGADGRVTFANAGHLPPYRRGREIPLPANLPLGVIDCAAVQFEETVIHLDAGESLTFLSDGVVEARSAGGELFGFDRAAKISVQSAEAVAQAAQIFGQEDDITVLRLTRSEAAAVAAPAMQAVTASL